jgi:catechol 2,3-dioxygenase-like lactoylglutathione lyase family enzyme
MDLGAFSVSLAVKDLEASRSFYEKFGFRAFAGDASQRWLILKNGDHAIGLFQGMFEKNILTFNPGWDGNAQKLATFTDVRELQRQLKKLGVNMISEADESSTGPASFMIADPDGNTILLINTYRQCVQLFFVCKQGTSQRVAADAAEGGVGFKNRSVGLQ